MSHYCKSIDNATYYMFLLKVFKDNYKFLINIKYLSLLVNFFIYFYFLILFPKIKNQKFIQNLQFLEADELSKKLIAKYKEINSD